MPPIRILHVTSVLNYGGIENTIMNLFRNIDRNKVIFDFLVIREDAGIFEKEILKLGGRIYKIPAIKKNGYFSFKKNLLSFFTNHSEYTIVHSHVNTINGPVLKCAKKCGIKTRISHAHTAYPEYLFLEKMIKNYFKSMINNVATDFFACSEIASKWLYEKNSKNSQVIINGIKTENFLFSEEKRMILRNELKINDKFVLLNVARFSKEKNHLFLLDILKEIVKKRDDALLVCIGDGELKSSFIEHVKKMKLSQHVLLINSIENVSDCYNIADVYVAPSLFEGFGISVAEAQFNSLPCVISESFPKEIIISSNCHFLSLSHSPTIWADTILSKERRYEIESKNPNIFMYDISFTADYLIRFYLKNA